MASKPATPNIAVFSGGVPYSISGPPPKPAPATLFTDLMNAGFTTVLLWGAEVDSKGDILMNAVPIVSKGKIVNDARAFVDAVNALKTTPGSSVNRVELSILSAEPNLSWNNIKSLGFFSANNPFCINLQKLVSSLNLDAINLDYEGELRYESAAATFLEQFGPWCSSAGIYLTMCPYLDGTQQWWQKLVTSINTANTGVVDALYLLTYGDATPSEWDPFFPFPVVPVFSSNQTVPSLVQTSLDGWAQSNIGMAGAAVWNGTSMIVGYDNGQHPPNGSPAQYFDALVNGLKG